MAGDAEGGGTRAEDAEGRLDRLIERLYEDGLSTEVINWFVRDPARPGVNASDDDFFRWSGARETELEAHQAVAQSQGPPPPLASHASEPEAMLASPAEHQQGRRAGEVEGGGTRDGAAYGRLDRLMEALYEDGLSTEVINWFVNDPQRPDVAASDDDFYHWAGRRSEELEAHQLVANYRGAPPPLSPPGLGLADDAVAAMAEHQKGHLAGEPESGGRRPRVTWWRCPQPHCGVTIDRTAVVAISEHQTGHVPEESQGEAGRSDDRLARLRSDLQGRGLSSAAIASFIGDTAGMPTEQPAYDAWLAERVQLWLARDAAKVNNTLHTARMAFNATVFMVITFIVVGIIFAVQAIR